MPRCDGGDGTEDDKAYLSSQRSESCVHEPVRILDLVPKDTSHFQRCISMPI
jgi:hypothetical protein